MAESIKSIINAFKAPSKTRKNWKEFESTIKRWHKVNVKKNTRMKQLRADNPDLKMTTPHKQKTNLPSNPDEWRNHPYMTKIK